VPAASSIVRWGSYGDCVGRVTVHRLHGQDELCAALVGDGYLTPNIWCKVLLMTLILCTWCLEFDTRSAVPPGALVLW
jgi:hypothetical protein